MEGFFDGQPFGFSFGNRRLGDAPGAYGPPDGPDGDEHMRIGWDPGCATCTAPGQCPRHRFDDPEWRSRAATGSLRPAPVEVAS